MRILIPLYVLAVLFAFFVVAFFSVSTETYMQVLEVRKDVQSVVAPKFLNISVETNNLIELAIEVWRMETRVKKNIDSLPEDQRELFQSSIKKMRRYLDKNDIEIVDHTNERFNDGRNLDILSVEIDPKIAHVMIKETKEPTVLHKGQVVRRGKVVILAKNMDGFEGVKSE